MSSSYNNIDDLFRDKFKNFEPEPPDHIWENIQQNIETNGGSSGKPFTKGGIAGLTTVIIIAGLFTFLNITGFQPEDAFIGDEFVEFNTVDNLLAVYSNSEVSNLAESDETSNSEEIELNKAETYESKITSSFQEETSTAISKEVISKDTQSSMNTIEQDDLYLEEDNDKLVNVVVEDKVFAETVQPGTDSDLLAMSGNSEQLSVFTSEVKHSSDEITDRINETKIEDASLPGEPAQPGIRSDYGKRGNFLFGLYFTPEMTYYPDDNSYKNRSYSIDVNAIYQFSGYMLQSGLGISWTKDNGNYMIDYEQYEYMGSYNDVYDITFDTIDGEIIPTYHTQEVDVYDSIEHVTISPTNYNYTYLQIPLLFGYGEEKGRFSWFVKGGPNLSVMIYEHRPEMKMPGTDINILNVNNELPSRIRANWQLLFSAGVSYKLSNNLRLSVEPMLRYYIKSAYDRTNMQTKHPYSVGLKTGLLINF